MDAPHACCRPTQTGESSTATARLTEAAFWSDRKVWRIAARNTLNCLIGCMIGDIAIILYMQAYHPHAPMAWSMGLGMAAGLVTSVLFESTLLRFREGLGWSGAFKMALSMSFLSMLGMELAANATDFMLTGGRVPFSDPFYWTALAISVSAGFLAPLPYNYWKFKQHGKACH
jgi:hypothetical protein